MENNEELYRLYSQRRIIKMIKSRMRWVEHVAHMGEIKKCVKMVVESLGENTTYKI